MKVLRVAISLSAILAACATSKPQPEQAAAPQPAPIAQPAPKAVVEAPKPAPAPEAQPPKPVAAPGAISIYFDFDKSVLLDSARGALAHLTIDLPKNVSIRIEGNCDERGSDEYNIALGQRRAEAAKKYLVNIGVPADQIATISYGEERPKLTGHDEASWRENRRDDIFVQAPAAVGMR